VGDEFMESLAEEFSFVEDDFVMNTSMTLVSISQKVSIQNPSRSGFMWLVAMNKCFAGPGGHIFFYTGLIHVMNQADELAAVICHELGICRTAPLIRIEQNKKLALATLAGMLAGVIDRGKDCRRYYDGYDGGRVASNN